MCASVTAAVYADRLVLDCIRLQAGEYGMLLYCADSDYSEQDMELLDKIMSADEWTKRIDEADPPIPPPVPRPMQILVVTKLLALAEGNPCANRDAARTALANLVMAGTKPKNYVPNWDHFGILLQETRWPEVKVRSFAL